MENKTPPNLGVSLSSIPYVVGEGFVGKKLGKVIHRLSTTYPQVIHSLLWITQLGMVSLANSTGSTQTPFTAISQWTCGPVLRPVLPLNPITSPCKTNCPGTT